MEHCAFPKNNSSPAILPAVAFAGSSMPVTVSFGARREVEHVLHLGHVIRFPADELAAVGFLFGI